MLILHLPKNGERPTDEERERLKNLENLVSEAPLPVNLSVRVYNLLMRKDFNTVGKAIEAFEKNPKICDGFGPKAQEEFKTMIDSCGIFVYVPLSQRQ